MEQILTEEDGYIIGFMNNFVENFRIHFFYPIWIVHGLKASKEVQHGFLIFQIPRKTNRLLIPEIDESREFFNPMGLCNPFVVDFHKINPKLVTCIINLFKLF